MENSKKTYITCQTASGFKAGDTVKCIAKANSNQFGWNNVWIEDMNNAVGKVGKIKKICEFGKGITIDFDEVVGCNYPFFVLEKIAEEEPTTIIDSDSTGFIPYTSRRGRRMSTGTIGTMGGYGDIEALDKMLAILDTYKTRKEEEEKKKDDTPPPDITMV